MTISPIYPIVLQNGTLADATQVMADFYQIQSDVNANAAHNGANTDITSLTGLTTPLGVSYGGTGAATPAGARTNLSAASSGINSDIISLTGLTTPLAVSEGGTSGTDGPSARTGIGAAASGANSDITSLTGLTTPLPISEGGTGANNAPQALINLGVVGIKGSGYFSGGFQYRTGVISSIVKNSTGNYSVFFSAQPGPTQYVINASLENNLVQPNPENIVNIEIANRTTTSFNILIATPGGGPLDFPFNVTMS